MELISHHLCPFLHRSIILLEKKGLKRNIDYTVTYFPIYDIPQWLYKLSPKGRSPILRVDGVVLGESVAINEYFNDTIEPNSFPDNPIETAVHRALLVACGDLLLHMRNVYTAKEENAMDMAIDKLFQGLLDISAALRPNITNCGKSQNAMMDSAFAGLFTLMNAFHRVKDSSKWVEMTDIQAYANMLASDNVVMATKCPDYCLEFDRFFNYFGSVFKVTAIPAMA